MGSEIKFLTPSARCISSICHHIWILGTYFLGKHFALPMVGAIVSSKRKAGKLTDNFSEQHYNKRIKTRLDCVMVEAGIDDMKGRMFNAM